MLPLSDDLLHQCLPGATDKNILKYHNAINLVCERYKINSILRISAFLAQVAHESGNFHYKEEIASGAAYDSRKDLGNTTETARQIAQEKNTSPGRLYKGRGLIQLTGFYNYEAYSKYKKQDFIHNPEQIAINPSYSCDVAGWFWNCHNCNLLADNKNFKQITRRINGGLNGYSDRLNHYLHILETLNNNSSQ